MALSYVDQSPEEIRLYVAQGDVDLSQFSVLEESSRSWQGCVVRFGILGASHFVSLSYNDARASEICACIPGSFTEDVTLHAADALTQFSDGIDVVIANTWRYRFSYYMAELHALPEILGTLTREGAERESLDVSFPDEEGEECGRTVIAVAAEDTMKVQTLHSYPNVGQCVLTESSFAFA